MDSEQAHKVVGVSMLTTFLVVLVAQNWFKHIRDWVGEQTHTGFTPAPDPNIPNRTTAVHWLVGLGGVWIVLSLLAETDDTAPIAAGFAGLIAFGVIIRYGTDAIDNLTGAAGVPTITPVNQVAAFSPPGTNFSVAKHGLQGP